MASLFELELLGEHSVYPGHPITIAYCIVKRFNNWKEATRTEEGHTYCNALGSMHISGAGGNVSNALYILRMLKDGMTFAEVCKRAEHMWQCCDSQADSKYTDEQKLKRYYEGTLQAVKYREKLKEVLDTGWLR